MSGAESLGGFAVVVESTAKGQEFIYGLLIRHKTHQQIKERTRIMTR